MLDRIDDFRLQKEYTRFKNDINSLSAVYDFNIRDETARNRECFSDPYHATEEIYNMLIDSVWQTTRFTETDF